MFYSIAREESDRLDKNGRGPLSLISMILECVKSLNYRYQICLPWLILEIIENGTAGILLTVLSKILLYKIRIRARGKYV